MMMTMMVATAVNATEADLYDFGTARTRLAATPRRWREG